VKGLHGDKTMYTNANVTPANNGVWSARSTGATRALTEGKGASETADRRPHAPRSAKPKDAALTELGLNISSTSKLNSATQRLRISDCAPPSLRLLDRIRASYRRRIGYSPTNRVSEIRGRICSRGRAAHPSYPLSASSVNSCRRQLAACCRPKSTQLRSKRRVDSPQTKSMSGPIPTAFHRVDFTRLQLESTTTHVRKQLIGTANDFRAHQIRRNKQ